MTPICDPKTALVLLDIETMGLEPESPVVEIAMLLVDRDLKQLDTWTSVVFARPALWERSCSGWALDAHMANGLYAESSMCGSFVWPVERNLFQVTIEAIAKLREWGFAPGQAVICGESIYMDRMWLREQMPQLDQFLDYQMVDVTSMRLVCERTYGLDLTEPMDKLKGPSVHRALPDCVRTLTELSCYRATIFEGVPFEGRVNVALGRGAV